MSNSYFFKEVYTIPESKRKDIEKALEKLAYNGIALFSAENPEEWSGNAKETLGKIIELTGSSLGHCLRFKYADNSFFTEVLNYVDTQYVFVFCDKIQASGLNFNVVKHQWIFVNGKWVFFTQNLEDFIADRDAKVALWKAIQQQFEQKAS